MSGHRTPSRILFLTSGKGYGGPTSFLFYLLSSLSRKRFDPSVAFYFYDAGPDIDRIRGLNVPVFFLNPKEEPREYVPVAWLLKMSRSHAVQRSKVLLRFLLRLAVSDVPTSLRMRRLIREVGIDAVILNNDVHYHVAGVLGAKLAGATCICRKAGGIGEGQLYKKYLTPWVSLFIAVSRATEEDQRANNPETRKLVTVYEGINLELFEDHRVSHANKSDLGLPPDKKIVTSVSRLDVGKGHRELLDAAALVIDEFNNVVFLIVGDGPTRDELQAQVKRLDLTDRIIFLGWRKDIPALLSITDIFVHCPTTFLEGLGIANLEAMAAGKPTIVSRNGGLPDAAVDGVTGYILSPGDVKGMASAMVRLLQDGRLARRLGENARTRAEKYFDIRKNVLEMEDLIVEAIERGR